MATGATNTGINNGEELNSPLVGNGSLDRQPAETVDGTRRLLSGLLLASTTGIGLRELAKGFVGTAEAAQPTKIVQAGGNDQFAQVINVKADVRKEDVIAAPFDCLVHVHPRQKEMVSSKIQKMPEAHRPYFYGLCTQIVSQGGESNKISMAIAHASTIAAEENYYGTIKGHGVINEIVDKIPGTKDYFISISLLWRKGIDTQVSFVDIIRQWSLTLGRQIG